MNYFRKWLAAILFLVATLAFISFLFHLTDSTSEIDKLQFLALRDLIFLFIPGLAGLFLWNIPRQMVQTELLTTQLVLSQSTLAGRESLEFQVDSPGLPSQWQIKEPTRFPQSIFNFKEYDGLKLLAIFLFLLSLVNFVRFYLPHSGLWKWLPFSRSTDFLLHLFPLICCYCLLWVAFDSKSFYGYAIGTFTVLFGLLYIISPLDISPDFIPIIGSADDAFVGGGSILMGIISYLKAHEQEKEYRSIINSMQQGDHREALKKLLENKGIILESRESK